MGLATEQTQSCQKEIQITDTLLLLLLLLVVVVVVVVVVTASVV
jgi:hypothetical protein